MDECEIVICECSDKDGRVHLEVNYEVNGEKRKRGWGFHPRAIETGAYIDIIKQKLDSEENMSEIPKKIKDEVNFIRGKKIDLKERRIKDNKGKEVRRYPHIEERKRKEKEGKIKDDSGI